MLLPIYYRRCRATCDATRKGASAVSRQWTVRRTTHRRSVPDFSPLKVHKRGISYLHQSVKWTVSRRSSAISKLVFLWKLTVLYVWLS